MRNIRYRDVSITILLVRKLVKNQFLYTLYLSPTFTSTSLFLFEINWKTPLTFMSKLEIIMFFLVRNMLILRVRMTPIFAG